MTRVQSPQKLEGGRRLRSGTRDASFLLTIVTVVFRAESELRTLIDSIVSLKDADIELIVIDGGSQDDTCAILSSYGDNIDYWVSESDNGIYDAMNKGVSLAQGTFILHINAGDRLLYIPKQELRTADENSFDAAAFHVLIDNKIEFRPSFSYSLRFNNTLHHQGTFFRKLALPKYNIEYKVFADFDVNQQLALRGARVALFGDIVASHLSEGVSDTPTPTTVSEFFRIIRKNYGALHLPIAWLMCKWRGLVSRIAQFRQ